MYSWVRRKHRASREKVFEGQLIQVRTYRERQWEGLQVGRPGGRGQGTLTESRGGVKRNRAKDKEVINLIREESHADFLSDSNSRVGMCDR